MDWGQKPKASLSPRCPAVLSNMVVLNLNPSSDAVGEMGTVIQPTFKPRRVEILQQI